MLLPTCAPAPEPEPEATPEPVFDQAAEEAAVRKAVEQMNAAFNNHDAEGMAVFWDETNENWSGNLKGVENKEYYSDLFKRHPAIRSELLEEIGIIFVTPDVAIYKSRRENTGYVDEEGKPLTQSRKSLMAWVQVKKGGKWMNVAFFSRPIIEQ
jgi:uncharacterized protein (TIGR02246 family)